MVCDRPGASAFSQLRPRFELCHAQLSRPVVSRPFRAPAYNVQIGCVIVMLGLVRSSGLLLGSDVTDSA